jgi:hypothetical protein
MVARPLMPNAPQPMSPVRHAQFQPSATEQLVGQVKGQVINEAMTKGMPIVTDALGITSAATPATAAAAPVAAAAAPVAAAAPLAAGAAAPLAAGAAAPLAAGAAGAGAAGAGAAGLAGAGLAAAAPIAVPALIAAKLFGLFNQGGRVPSETMTAHDPQQNTAPTQTGGPLSFKHAEQQQKLALKQATFDADQKRKEEAHRMKMMQQQQKLTEAASGFQTPLSAR